MNNKSGINSSFCEEVFIVTKNRLVSISGGGKD